MDELEHPSPGPELLDPPPPSELEEFGEALTAGAPVGALVERLESLAQVHSAEVAQLLSAVSTSERGQLERGPDGLLLGTHAVLLLARMPPELAAVPPERLQRAQGDLTTVRRRARLSLAITVLLGAAWLALSVLRVPALGPIAPFGLSLALAASLTGSRSAWARLAPAVLVLVGFFLLSTQRDFGPLVVAFGWVMIGVLLTRLGRRLRMLPAPKVP